MSDDKKEGAVAPAKDAEGSKTYTEEQFAEIQEKLSITEANLEKSRKGENFNRSKRLELEEQIKSMPNVAELQTKYDSVSKELETFKTARTTEIVDAALKAEVEKAGAISVSTVLKLVDRSKISLVDGKVDTKSVEAVIGELKKTDSVLFNAKKEVPSLKQPGNGNASDGFKTEIKAAKTPQELQAVMTKYGIKSSI